jgi:hypothetical protein
MMKQVDKAIDIVSRNFFRHCMRYIRGYQQKISAFNIDKHVKKERDAARVADPKRRKRHRGG